MKASDVAAQRVPFFGQSGTFDETFPEIADLEISVEETDGGWPVEHGEHRFTFSNRQHLRPYINCRNRACYNGGISIERLLSMMIAARSTLFEDQERCQGYEGSPKGQRRYRDCMHAFKVRIKLAFKEAPEIRDATGLLKPSNP